MRPVFPFLVILSAAAVAFICAAVTHDVLGVPRAIVRAGALFGSGFIAVAVAGLSVPSRKK
jgi:hypothetical protein